MKIVLALLAVVAAFSFVGCSDYNLFPAADQAEYTGKFGSTEVEAFVAFPKDTKGKLMLLEIQTHEDDLEGASEINNSVNPAPASAIGDLFSDSEVTPEVNKEFRGIRYMVVDFDQSNNPAVVELTAQLNQAIAEEDTKRVELISQALSEISGNVISKVVNPLIQ